MFYAKNTEMVRWEHTPSRYSSWLNTALYEQGSWKRNFEGVGNKTQMKC